MLDIRRLNHLSRIINLALRDNSHYIYLKKTTSDVPLVYIHTIFLSTSFSYSNTSLNTLLLNTELETRFFQMSAT